MDYRSCLLLSALSLTNIFSATIDLNKNGLSGEIPPEIYNLGGLVQLYLNQNPNLGGGLSPSISNLMSLERLRLGDTNMGGVIPDEFFHLTNLKEFEIPRANFVGRLDLMSSALLNFTELEDLDLAYNDFTGSIPDIFLQFEHLGKS